MDQTELDRFVDLVYDAALDPDLWPAVLAGFVALTGSSGGVLIQQNEETGKGVGIRANVDPTAQELYYGHFATRNVLQRAEDPREWLKAWTPRVLTDENKLPKPSLMRTEYYNDFMRRFDMHSLMIVRVAVRDMDAVSVNLIRPANRDQFGEAEIDLARWIMPHLRRAYGLGQKLAATRVVGEDITKTLDTSAHGLFLVDESSRVRHANKAAKRFLAEKDGLRMLDGRLGAARSEDARALGALIRAAASADAARRSGGSMPLATPSRVLPLSVTVAPINAERRLIFDASPSAIVCVTDLEAGVSLPQQKLRDLFGLTPAETRLALALFEGLTLREAADRFGVSIHTAHAQIAHIFDKTGAQRQSGLVRLMMRAAGAHLT